MKIQLTILFVAFFSLFNYAQRNYDDLKILYADANYEKLAKVGKGYVSNDKYKKDIPPYIWLSKGLYKISLSGTSDPKYKNAYKEAIKYFGAGLKYDLKYNNGETYAEHSEFVNTFQNSLAELIDNEVSSGNFKRAYGWCIKYGKISPNKLASKYLMGACKFEDMDKASARTLWQEASKLMDEVTTLDGWNEADLMMFKNGLLYSAAAMIKGRQNGPAKDLLNKASQWFEEDEDWKERYDDIVN